MLMLLELAGSFLFIEVILLGMSGLAKMRDQVRAKLIFFDAADR